MIFTFRDFRLPVWRETTNFKQLNYQPFYQKLKLSDETLKSEIQHKNRNIVKIKCQHYKRLQTKRVEEILHTLIQRLFNLTFLPHLSSARELQSCFTHLEALAEVVRYEQQKTHLHISKKVYDMGQPHKQSMLRIVSSPPGTMDM